MKKLRADSTFAAIPAPLRARVDDMLYAGAGYEAVRDALAEDGHRLSITSISQYYKTHLLPAKWMAQTQAAELLEQIDQGQIDAATHAAVKQAAYELATTPGASPKDIKALYTLVLKAMSLQHDDRKIALLEARAAAADAARESLQKKVAEGGLTPEALALAEEQLRLL